MRFLKSTCLGLAAAIVSACAIYEIDAPPPGPEDYWSKNGFTKPQIRSALTVCGEDKARSIQDSEGVDFCMLRQGFVFVDVERSAHKMCRTSSDTWTTPGCRSLRGDLVITPDKAALLPPPVADEKPSDPPAIPIAPSASPTQLLQERVQQNSNRQMKQLLQGSAGR